MIEVTLCAQTQDFFACDSSAPVRVEHKGGAAAWLAGTLAVPSVQGHGLPPQQELWPYQSLFLSLLQLAIRRPLWPVFLCSSGLTPVCSYLQCPQLSELVHFLLWEISITYIFHRHRVCLVDHKDLIGSLYSWLEGFGSSSLATLPLDFNCGFISTSACGSSTGVCS